MNNLIVLNQNDNVGVSQFIIPEKTKIEGHEISTVDPIPFGHKVCLKTIKKGDPIIKYDQIIGFEDKLSDKEIDSVLAYMKSYWSKENYEYQLKLN